MPRMIIPPRNTGLGWCTWYRSSRRTPSRFALATARCSTTGATGSTGKIFVARKADSRASPTPRPPRLAERLAQDPLAAAETVDLGRVEQGHAQLQRPAHDGVCLLPGVGRP